MSKEEMKMTLLYEYELYEPKCTISGLAKVYAGLWGRWDILQHMAFISIVYMLWENQKRIFLVKVEERGSVDEARDVLVQRFLAPLSLFDPAQILPLFLCEKWTNVKVRSVNERQPLARESLHSGPQHTCHSSEWLSGLKGKQQDLHLELIIINMLIWRRLRTSSCDTVASEEWSR